MRGRDAPGPRLSLPSLSPKNRALCVTTSGTSPRFLSPSSPLSSLNAALSLSYSKAFGARPTTTLSKGGEEGGKSVRAEGVRRYSGLRRRRTEDCVSDALVASRALSGATHLRTRSATSPRTAESEVNSCRRRGVVRLVRAAGAKEGTNLFFSHVELHLLHLLQQRRPCARKEKRQRARERGVGEEEDARDSLDVFETKRRTTPALLRRCIAAAAPAVGTSPTWSVPERSTNKAARCLGGGGVRTGDRWVERGAERTWACCRWL